MVDFRVRWEIVNGMWAARAQGHGCVSRYLRGRRVPRSSAYRWKRELESLLEDGGREVRRLRRERDELAATLAQLSGAPEGDGQLRGRREWAFLLAAAVRANSDEEAGALLRRAGGRSLSHQTIHAIIAQAGAVARVVYERFFAGVGNVAAADEIFLGRSPLLLMVGPLSLLISGLRLADRCTAEAWEPLFGQMGDLEGYGADGGSALGKAGAEAKVPLHADMFHLLRPARTRLASLGRTYGSKKKALAKAEQAVEKARFRGGKHAGRPAGQRYRRAREAAERVVEEYCRLGDLLERVAQAFEWTTPEGTVRTASEARATVAEALEAMRQTPEGRRLADDLARVERCEAAFTHLEVLASGLSALHLEQVGPDREATLGKLVAETVAWRRVDKEPVAVLEQASNGSLADAVEIAVIKLVDRAIRSSSSVECVNCRVRLVQVARKRLSEDFICLLAVYHNMKPFGRGSVREGKSPAELAGIELPTSDWIELLDLTAKELAQAAEQAA
ncbi:MAG: hypothetical protein ACE5JD_18090 [Candidatus Methylomirabilia bacterium]